MTLLAYAIAALNLLLNFLLIPKYGYFGAAWASLFTYTLSPLINYYFSKRYFSFEINWLRFSLGLIFGLIFVLNYNLFDKMSLALKLMVKIALLLLLAVVYFFTLPSDHKLKAISLFKK
jgi:O-antigen/teichoic acid export membrane protein